VVSAVANCKSLLEWSLLSSSKASSGSEQPPVVLSSFCWFNVINLPVLHFLWVIGSFFLAFYAISTLTNYTAAVVFAIMIAVGVPFWDRHVSAETNVEDTLWLCLSVLIGVVITAAVELAFVRLLSGDEVGLPIAERQSGIY
jgi:hypothetical protein